jgi:hypothetical protein
VAVAAFTLPFTNTPAFFTGTGQTTLVPSIYPVAINGRPYMIDQKSGEFQRGYEPRVRDSQDISTAPGEAAINPGGLWRRGHDSWHLGAGQQYSDVADSQDYRFYKSKGIDPWTKGQISLLNSTVLRSNSTFSGTNLPMVEINGYLYVGDGNTLKYTQDPFTASPSWTSVTGGDTPATTAINDIATDGRQIYIAYNNNGILMTTPGSANNTDHYATTGGTFNYTKLGFAKGFLLGFHNDTSNSHVHAVPFSASTSHGSAVATIRDTSFTCAGFAGGQNHIYMAGRSNDSGLVYKFGIKADGTIDVAIVALQLPTGEYPTSIFGYLGFILLGTNKGVRFCSSDSNGNLVAGAVIPTSGNVNCFTAEDKYVWFGWSNYDGVSGGLGRLDLSTFTSTNVPAYATDLMYGSSAAVLSAATMSSKRLFAISAVGVIAENADSLVASGNIELGTYRWGIPDRKFVARVDVRSEPLKGSVNAYLSNDEESYEDLGTWSTVSDTENTFTGSDQKTIEAKFKLLLTRSSTVTEGPVVTRWMARAYAAPFRSQTFSVPVLLHNKLKLRNNREVFIDVQEETDTLDELLSNPKIIVLQLGSTTHSVIVEDIRWVPVDSYGNKWEWEGTAVVIMRSVEN